MKVARVSKSGKALVVFVPRELLAALDLHHRDYVTWSLVAETLVLKKLTQEDAGATFTEDHVASARPSKVRRRA